MILGIGTDLIEIERIKRSFERYGARFLDRIFTEREQNYCLKHKQKETHLAGRFAAKEAISKALGTGITEIVGWKDIEIINNTQGKPEVILSNAILANHFNQQGHLYIQLSISHTHTHALAFAIIEKMES